LTWHTDSLTKIITLAVVGLWPLIPIFWLPMRIWPCLKRICGAFYFVLTGIVWLPWAYLVWSNQAFILAKFFDMPSIIRWFGMLSLALGVALQGLTAIRLGRRILGLHELNKEENVSLEQSFPFNVCRHPTYLSHFMMFWGAALYTGNIWVGLVALLDLVVTVTLIVPFEEKELERIFGEDYIKYSQSTGRFIPRFFHRR